MRPSHHFGIFRRLNRFLKIVLGAVPIPVGDGHLREDKQGSTLVTNFLIQRLLRQFLRTFGIARSEALFRAEQHSPLFRTR